VAEVLGKGALVGLLAVSTIGCSDGAGAAAPPLHPQQPPPPLAAAPVELQVAPRWISEECATVALLRPVCPAALPHGNPGFTTAVVWADRRPVSFSVEAGAAHEAQGARNRPPGYFHVTVSVRRLGANRGAAWLHPRLPRLQRAMC